MQELFDITVIGGGPAGLYSTFYAGVRKLKVKCIEAAPALGGRLLLYPNYTISDVGGQLPILCQNFTNNLIAQAKTFEPTICLNEQVVSIKEVDNQIIIYTTKGMHYTKTVLFATGIGYFEPKKMPMIPVSPAMERFYVKSIENREQFIDKDVVVIGNTNMTAEWAIQLKQTAKSVTVLSTDKKWQIQMSLLEQLLAKNIRLVNNVTYANSYEAKEQLFLEFEEQTVCAHYIVVQLGYQRKTVSDDIKLASTLPSGVFKGMVTGRTTHPKIFAAGDCLHFDGKINFIVGAFHDAMNAVNFAAHEIDESNQLSVTVSTHNPIFRTKL